MTGGNWLGGKRNGVAVATVQLLPVAIDAVGRIHRFLLRVAVDAEHGGGHAVEVIVLQVLPRAEHVAGGHLPRFDPLLQSREVGPGVGHALLDRRLHLGGEFARVEGLARTDADFGEARHEFLLGRGRRGRTAAGSSGC